MQFSVDVRSGPRSLVKIDEFGIPQNEITFLFGESGIGKSIICKAIYGLLDPDQLSVTINTRPYAEYLGHAWTEEIRKNSFFVFQEPSSHLNSRLLISEQLNEGSLKNGCNEQEILEKLWEDSDRSTLEKILAIYPKPYRPSGGEKQRILLAMAFKKICGMQHSTSDHPSFYVFDEPTGSLDNAHRNRFLRLLIEKYRETPFTIMIITHDYSIISEIYGQYRTLLEQVHFKELSRVNDSSVEVHDFSAQEYLQWLSATKASLAPVNPGEKILDVDPSFTIFNRQLRIFKDPGHTQQANLVINRGETVYVKAPSGIGKTTLAKIIMGLYPPQKFSMTLCGDRITEKTPLNEWSRIWGKAAGMVFQHADESLDMEATVSETFRGLSTRQPLDESGTKSLLLELFDKSVVTDSFMKKKVKYLSGGQKQRLNLLRTLVLGTDLVVLDEPLNALDFHSVKRVLLMLEERRKKGTALLMISHNEEIFDALVDSGHVYYLGE